MQAMGNSCLRSYDIAWTQKVHERLFLYLYEIDFIQKLLRKNEKKLVWFFNFMFQTIPESFVPIESEIFEEIIKLWNVSNDNGQNLTNFVNDNQMNMLWRPYCDRDGLVYGV
jgi:hypothetical protein